MNKILDDIIQSRKGHYCHVVELDSAYDLESYIDSLVQEFEPEYSYTDIVEFFDNLEVIYYCEDDTQENEQDEAELYAFDVVEYVRELLQ